MDDKKRRLIPVLLLMVHAASFAAPLLSVDLASDREWTLAIDGDATTLRSIKVPGAGWNSDMQEPRIDRLKGVDQYVEYTRKFSIPAETATQVTKIEFGAVNYGAEVYLNNELVATHHGPMMPFEADMRWIGNEREAPPLNNHIKKGSPCL